MIPGCTCPQIFLALLPKSAKFIRFYAKKSMKKFHWLIVLFVVWCLLAASWYLFSVKNLSTEPSEFSAGAMLVGIGEVLVMMLVAFIIGFAIAWTMQQDPIKNAYEKQLDAEYQIEVLHQELHATRNEASALAKKLNHADEYLNTLLEEKEKQQKFGETASHQTELWQKQVREQELKVQQLEGEVTSSKFRVRLLENEVTEKDNAIASLKAELSSKDKTPAATHRDWSDHPFVRPIESNGEAEKDDLTQIKGIGPKFMQKLNALDIFSFRQLSELSGEEVERLAEVIEVFPDRIHRDNWIGQATKLHLKKTNRE